MPISITGTGTITGISAGGLPDDCITTAEIAGSAVTTAKVNAASITAAKLDGAQIGSAPIYGARAWVSFDGTRNEGDTGASTDGANVKIRASGNVSSVLKNATGDFTINFTIAMPDANYVATGLTNEFVLGNRSSGWNIRGTDASFVTAESLRIDTGSQSSGSAADQTVATVVIFR